MTIKLAVDCMGGDFGPSVTIPAVFNFLCYTKDAEVFLVGVKEVIDIEINRCIVRYRKPQVKRIVDRIHVAVASQVILMDDSIETALRRKKGSSMHVALDLVKRGVCQVCISAGNTGALVAVSRFVLKTISNIERPVLAALMPNLNGYTTVLDLGANIACEPKHLFQFAQMGHALVSSVDGKPFPSIGLLNVGEEAIKGSEVTKKTAELLRSSNLNFYGNVEGNDIYRGTTDIVVCDGFVGNVALKASEGLAQMLNAAVKEEFSKNFLTKILAAIAWPVLRRLKNRLDHRKYSGAILLGLKGLVVKSHGSADIFAFSAAIQRGYCAAKAEVQSRLATALEVELKE